MTSVRGAARIPEIRVPFEGVYDEFGIDPE